MSRGLWKKPVKCLRGGGCNKCRACKVRVNSARLPGAEGGEANEKESKLTDILGVLLLRSDAAERDAFLGVHKQIANTLGITIINGVPA